MQREKELARGMDGDMSWDSQCIWGKFSGDSKWQMSPDNCECQSVELDEAVNIWRKCRGRNNWCERWKEI